MVSYLIDAILAVMLINATVFLVIVNKRLKLLRSSQSELNGLIGTFSRTIDETDASVKRLVGAAADISGKLAGDVDRAKAIHEDATLLLGACERATKRMEESVQLARSLTRRLDEGTLSTLRTGNAPGAVPGAPPAGMAAAAAPSAPAPVPTAAPVPAPLPEPVESRLAAALPERGSDDGFRPMLVPDTAPVAAMAAAPAFPESRPEPVRQKAAVGAFYARLRTIGSET